MKQQGPCYVHLFYGVIIFIKNIYFFNVTYQLALDPRQLGGTAGTSPRKPPGIFVRFGASSSEPSDSGFRCLRSSQIVTSAPNRTSKLLVNFQTTCRILQTYSFRSRPCVSEPGAVRNAGDEKLDVRTRKAAGAAKAARCASVHAWRRSLVSKARGRSLIETQAVKSCSNASKHSRMSCGRWVVAWICCQIQPLAEESGRVR